jgi:hypothetical protein
MIHPSVVLRRQHFSLLYRRVTDQSELLLDSSTEGHLLAHSRADRVIQLDLHDVLR